MLFSFGKLLKSLRCEHLNLDHAEPIYVLIRCSHLRSLNNFHDVIRYKLLHLRVHGHIKIHRYMHRYIHV